MAGRREGPDTGRRPAATPGEIRHFVEEQRTSHANIDTRLDRIDARLDRIEGDTGTLKGDFARTRTVQDAPGIASDMGLQFVRTLSAPMN